jgi:hypothetical protein
MTVDRAAIGRSSRRKGQVSERALAAELSALLGVEVKRRVRNHAGDSDLVGLPGWAAESKCCAKPALSAWWKQTVEQTRECEVPVLFYKLPRKPFRAVVPICLLVGGDLHLDVEQTMDLSLAGFAALYREMEATGLEVEQRIKNSMLKMWAKLQ